MQSVNPNGTRHHYEPGLKEGSWKGMKKRLERDYLCEKLQGRVQYHCEVYPKWSDGSACFHVMLDGVTIKKFGFFASSARLGWPHGHIGSIPMSARDEYSDEEFAESLAAYRNQPIADSLNSPNPIQRMFAIVDRRVGKRTLQRMAMNVNDQPEWLRTLYLARMAAENILPSCAAMST